MALERWWEEIKCLWDYVCVRTRADLGDSDIQEACKLYSAWFSLKIGIDRWSIRSDHLTPLCTEVRPTTSRSFRAYIAVVADKKNLSNGHENSTEPPNFYWSKRKALPFGRGKTNNTRVS